VRHGEGENTGDERCRRTGLCRADGGPWLLPGTRLFLTRGCSESPRRVSSRWMSGLTRGASSSVRRASTSALARTCAIRALPRSGGSIATSLPCSRSGRRSSPPSGGATVGGGFGCALSADDPAERAGSRLTANFAREAEADARAGLPSTAHFREGVSALIERRTPNFGGTSSHHGCAPGRQRPLASTHA
jgi:hypothetical protein